MNHLAFTAERVHPDDPSTEYWFKRNLAGYHVVLPSIRPRQRVLDLGCGEGYGLALVKSRGASCVGVDLSPEAVSHASCKYRLDLLVGDVCHLPLADQSFDVVVSLQVIEHLRSIDSYLREMLRLLRPGGRAWISTPNRLTYVGSPYHVQEFSATELAERLKAFFTVRQMWGLRLQPGKQIYYQAVVAQTPARDYWANTQIESAAQKLPGGIREALPRPIKKLCRRLVWNWGPAPLAAEDFLPATQALEESLDLIALVEKG